jgi:hypothetical protein
MDTKKLTHLVYRFRAKPSGLLPTPPDKRDFQTGIFRWLGYQAKHPRHEIPTLSVRTQLFNTCQWAATTVQKEPDEKEYLNIRLLVARGRKLGLVSGDGFSNLRSGQKVLQDWGIPPRTAITEDASHWELYSGVNTDLYTDRASQHKTSSFWSVSSRNDLLKLLDENRIITTGLMWYTGFNQGGGFSSPWIISKPVGYQVGGHAFVIIGYDMNYQGRKVYICQNSYGFNWGDKGRFYVDMDYLDKNGYSYFTNLDEINKDLGKFLNEYDGQNVKGILPTVYYVQAGKLKAYPDEITYLAYNVIDRHITNYKQVDDNLIRQAEKGDNMDITKSLYWDFLKNVDNQNRLKKLIEVISR